MQQKGDLIYGIHPVAELLRSRKRKVISLFIEIGRTGQHISEIVQLARRNNVKIDRRNPRDMDTLARKGNHQGVVVFAAPLRVMSLDDAAEAAEHDKTAVWLAVDEITDPQNLGSMIRSAAFLGASTMLLPGRRTVGITPAVHKAACGALENIQIVSVANLNNAILQLKEYGFWIYGADMSGRSITKMTYQTPALIVIGSEGSGLRQKTLEHCDEVISIPQKGGESLNAACAASVIIYDVIAKTQVKK